MCQQVTHSGKGEDETLNRIWKKSKTKIMIRTRENLTWSFLSTEMTKFPWAKNSKLSQAVTKLLHYNTYSLIIVFSKYSIALCHANTYVDSQRNNLRLCLYAHNICSRLQQPFFLSPFNETYKRKKRLCTQLEV